MRKTRADARIELVSPFPEVSLPVAWGWIRPVLHLLADDFAMRDIASLFEVAKSIEERGGKTWGVLRSGQLCGWLGFEPVNAVSCFGHAFFAKWAWGKETTDAAVKLALQEIYDLGFEKVTCPVLAANRGIRGLLRRVGMTEEGTLRSHTLCGGKPADLILFGELKAEFTHGNFSGIGRTTGRAEQHDGSADGNTELDANGRIHVDEHADVHGGADRAAGDNVGGTPELHHERAEHDAGDDDRNGRDQQQLQRDRRPSTAKPRQPGIRKRWNKRNGGTANRSRKSGSNGKPVGPVAGSSSAAATPGAGAGD